MSERESEPKPTEPESEPKSTKPEPQPAPESEMTDQQKRVEERQRRITELMEERKSEASITITAALRARRFRKLLCNSSITGHDPSLGHLRTCVVRRIAAIGHMNMEDNVAKVCNFYRKLFHNEEGTAIAIQNRTTRGLSAREFAYGEIQFNFFVDVLKSAKPRRGEKFVDLGSGMGKAVFAAHLYFQFGTCLGIEFLEDLHDEANKCARAFDNEVKGMFDEAKRAQRIAFENKNFMHAHWKDADVVFVSCTSFGDETMAGISKKCEQLKPGARIITLTRQLVQSDAKAFKEINRCHCITTFGPGTAFVYERIDPLALEKDRERRREEAGADIFDFSQLN